MTKKDKKYLIITLVSIAVFLVISNLLNVPLSYLKIKAVAGIGSSGINGVLCSLGVIGLNLVTPVLMIVLCIFLISLYKKSMSD